MATNGRFHAPDNLPQVKQPLYLLDGSRSLLYLRVRVPPGGKLRHLMEHLEP
jgi:hypothetical protein